MNDENINLALNQIRLASNILVLPTAGLNLDAVGAALAIKEFLKNQDKQVSVLVTTPAPPKFGFLPEISKLEPAASLTKKLVVNVSLDKTKLSELTYQKLEERLRIFLTPKGGEFKASDVTIEESVYPFDLIITLGLDSLEELGEFYGTHAQMFFDVPIINIDYRASNENFGQINVVKLTASALSEVIFDLFNQYDPNLIDERVSTLLLSGLIFQTNSFQSLKTSPQVFLKASTLVSQGGKQQEIISQLYRSKSLGLLHLWGRVLARLKQDQENQLVYSVISTQDIEKSGAKASDVDEIIFEMTQQLSFAKHFVFLVESLNSTIVYICLGAPINAYNVFAAYQPQALASSACKFTVPKPLAAAENEVIAKLKEELAKGRA